MDSIRKQIMLLTWMMNKSDKNKQLFADESTEDDIAEFLYLCLEPGQTLEDLTLERMAVTLIDAVRFHLGTLDAFTASIPGWTTEKALQYYGREASK